MTSGHACLEEAAVQFKYRLTINFSLKWSSPAILGNQIPGFPSYAVLKEEKIFNASVT